MDVRPPVGTPVEIKRVLLISFATILSELSGYDVFRWGRAVYFAWARAVLCHEFYEMGVIATVVVAVDLRATGSEVFAG